MAIRKTPLGKLSTEQINKLLLAGQKMSNWFFNAKQSAGTSNSFAPAQIRVDAAAMQEEWDEIKRAEATNADSR